MFLCPIYDNYISSFQSHSSVTADAILQDLTALITKVGDFPVARGGFGEVWKCIYQTDLGPTDVRLHFFLCISAGLNFAGRSEIIACVCL